MPDPNIASSSLFYDSIADLSELLKKILSDQDLVKTLSLNAISNSEKYSLETVAECFQENVKKMAGYV